MNASSAVFRFSRWPDHPIYIGGIMVLTLTSDHLPGHKNPAENTMAVKTDLEYRVSEAPAQNRERQPNHGVPLNLDWVEDVRVNTSAVERRTESLTKRRTVKKEWQAAWLLRTISCMDLTTLSGDDTEQRVLRLCAKARQPVQKGLMQQLGLEDFQLKVAAVCVYHTFVETALRALEGTGINVAAVSTGFPAGLS